MPTSIRDQHCSRTSLSWGNTDIDIDAGPHEVSRDHLIHTDHTPHARQCTTPLTGTIVRSSQDSPAAAIRFGALPLGLIANPLGQLAYDSQSRIRATTSRVPARLLSFDHSPHGEPSFPHASLPRSHPESFSFVPQALLPVSVRPRLVTRLLRGWACRIHTFLRRNRVCSALLLRTAVAATRLGRAQPFLSYRPARPSARLELPILRSVDMPVSLPGLSSRQPPPSPNSSLANLVFLMTPFRGLGGTLPMIHVHVVMLLTARSPLYNIRPVVPSSRFLFATSIPPLEPRVPGLPLRCILENPNRANPSLRWTQTALYAVPQHRPPVTAKPRVWTWLSSKPKTA